MKKIVHLSDLHFGRLSSEVLTALQTKLGVLNPDFIIVSGDLTQRAKKSEYQAAANFLKNLGAPYLVIPGNHDQPLYRFWERLLAPLRKYKKYISGDYEPVYADPASEFMAIGISTPRRFRVIEGSVSARQATRVFNKLADLPKETIKLLVAHHPPLLMKNKWAKKLLRANFDLLLSGHEHIAGLQVVSSGERSFIDCAAGTSFGAYLKHTPNSFNLISLDFPKVMVELFDMDTKNNKFVSNGKQVFTKGSTGWKKLLT
jgi:predicted MPP superfamily phosphohydrolase